MMKEPTPTVVSPVPQLAIREVDLPADLRRRLQAERDETYTLGGGSDTLQALFDALPGVIAHRLQRLLPPELVLAEVELKLALDVKVPGFRCGGDVTVKLRPDAQRTDTATKKAT
jgi:hypothetical protein